MPGEQHFVQRLYAASMGQAWQRSWQRSCRLGARVQVIAHEK